MDGVLNTSILRNLSDRQYEKRKIAAVEIEARWRAVFGMHPFL